MNFIFHSKNNKSSLNNHISPLYKQDKNIKMKKWIYLILIYNQNEYLRRRGKIKSMKKNNYNRNKYRNNLFICSIIKNFRNNSNEFEIRITHSVVAFTEEKRYISEEAKINLFKPKESIIV